MKHYSQQDRLEKKKKRKNLAKTTQVISRADRGNGMDIDKKLIKETEPQYKDCSCHLRSEVGTSYIPIIQIKIDATGAGQ